MEPVGERERELYNFFFLGGVNNIEKYAFQINNTSAINVNKVNHSNSIPFDIARFCLPRL
jgi:hypothetical protein